MKILPISLLRLFLPTTVCLLSGCGSGSSDDSVSPHADVQPTLPAVFISKTGIENGQPAGIRLAIQWKKDTDSTSVYTLMSSYEGKPIGLTLILPREKISKPARSAWLRTAGPPSDLFLHILATQYNVALNANSRFADSVQFTCLNLGQILGSDSANKSNWIAADYKLFFDTESDSGDAELFMNINADKQYIEFAEKDQDYRKHLINLFTRH